MVGGLSWTYFASAATTAIQVGYIAAISRLLPPSAFGSVALAGVSLVAAQYLANFGISQALIQRSEVTSETVRVAFTVSLLLSIGVTAAVMLVAPLLGALVGSHDVTSIVRALAVGFVITSAGAPSLALLRRAHRFKALAMINLSSYVLGTVIVGLTLALLGLGVWSLVLATLGQTLLATVLAFSLVRHSVRPTLRSADRRSLMSFGGRVSAIGFMEFLTGNVDTLAVGRVFGDAVLGQYARATSLVSLPMYQVIEGASRVMFPSFSRIKDDDELLGRAYGGGLAMITAIVVPAAALLATLAKPAVSVMLGNQWGVAAQLLPILACAYAFDFSSSLGAVLLEAEGMLKQKLVLLAVHLSAIAVAVAILVRIGLSVLWFAVAWAGGMAIRHIGYQILLDRRLSISRMWLIRVQLEAVALAALVAAAGAVAMHALRGWPGLQLVIGGGAGILMWLTFVALVRGMEARREIMRFGLVQRLPVVGKWLH